MKTTRKHTILYTFCGRRCVFSAFCEGSVHPQNIFLYTFCGRRSQNHSLRSTGAVYKKIWPRWVIYNNGKWAVFFCTRGGAPPGASDTRGSPKLDVPPAFRYKASFFKHICLRTMCGCSLRSRQRACPAALLPKAVISRSQNKDQILGQDPVDAEV